MTDDKDASAEQGWEDNPANLSDDPSEGVFYSITVSYVTATATKSNNEAFTTIDIMRPDLLGVKQLRMKIDTGAGASTLPLRTIKQMYGDDWRSRIQPAKAKLTAYNGTTIICLGSMDIMCRYKDSVWSKQRFYVVDVPSPAIAGLPLCKELKVVTIHSVNQPACLAQTVDNRIDSPGPVKSIDNLKRRFPKQFAPLGNFKAKAHLYLKEDATPSIDAPRKCSIHLKPKLKAELDQMEKDGVIRYVDHHTDWCSSITTSVKKDGSLRICLDPKRLNDSLRRCPHKIPTLEELNPAFADARYFSKLDAKAGYWSVHLDQKSQELTTFRTPFGRYCFKRLPFGLSVSQDIFQQGMDHIINQVPGCVGIADDIAVYGRTEAKHDANLLSLMQTAEREGLVFNSSKCRIRDNKINFFGSIYSNTGIRPDPGRIEDIHAIPSPQDKEDLQKFLGLMNYVSTYIPHFATKAASLRDPLRKDTPYTWQEDHQASFNAIKGSISSTSCLQYYDPSKPTTLEVDASQKGLGACLLQEDKPVAFASKSLSKAQSCYSNIERETLALIFGIGRFHTYLFGTDFHVYTDHKPLVTICNKALTSAPPRLQRLLIKILGYNLSIAYKQGSSMILADALSRLPNPMKRDSIPLDVHVDDMDLSDNPTTEDIDLVHFGCSKRETLRHQTASDPVMRELQQVIYSGWPETFKELPSPLRIYWP